MTAATTSPLLHVKLAGLVTGLVLAAGLVLFMRIPQEDGRLGADVRLVATPPAGIKAGSGAFLTGRHLTSGGEAATGKLMLANDKPREAVVSFRALAPKDKLSRLIAIELRLDGKKVAGGSLAQMRRWSGKLRIPGGSSRTLSASAWVPGSVRDGYEAKSADISLDIRSKAARR
jgi:hypothetical protein